VDEDGDVEEALEVLEVLGGLDIYR